MLKNLMENISVLISPSPSKHVIIGAMVEVAVWEWTQLHVRPYQQGVKEQQLAYFSSAIILFTQRRRKQGSFAQKKPKTGKPKIQCQPLCSQPMRNSTAQLCFNKLLQCQKSLKLQLIETNCNTRISCIFVQIHLLPNFM